MLGFENLRPWGNISSIGVHNGEIPWTGNQAYGKNLRIQMGRCPVRSEYHRLHQPAPLKFSIGLFEEALEALARHQHELDFMFENIVPLSKAVEYYDLFNQMKVQKVVFEGNKVS